MEMGPKAEDGQDEDTCHKERGSRTAGHPFCVTFVPFYSPFKKKKTWEERKTKYIVLSGQTSGTAS